MKASLTASALALGLAFGPAAQAAAPAGGAAVPVVYKKLPNGLKVVLSPDHTAPTVVVGVYYNIGFRIEPRDRTGFAHLFEHLMFQGSKNLGKMEFIKLVQSNGGILNGSTRFDFTNYFEVVPANALRTVLWAEADRMRGLAITKDNLVNQQGVVKNEVKVNVLNRPYGGFPWLDMPQAANVNWFNAHNFYGDLKDLDAATLSDAEAFFKAFYAPDNAALVVVGDFEPEAAWKLVQQYFGPIPTSPRPGKPDITEPRQEKERRVSKQDPLAPRPALAIGYHAPPRNTPEYYAFGLLDTILAQGKDSRLYEALVRKTGLTGEVDASINALGNMFNIAGPTLWTVSLFHDREKTSDAILKVFDEEIDKVRTTPVDQATLDRTLVKMRSGLYTMEEDLFGFGRADLLTSFALFDDDPARINGLEDEFRKVTPALIQKTAREYLRPTNRTILAVEPKAEASKLPAAPAPKM
jgi:zinc protease